ncbi:MAG: DUF4202 domain-containing protein [Candidatus Omnitrophica bacterium]|nr:DUF4202 domain-containing protein [Candidatus Omnitrophota bacterium]
MTMDPERLARLLARIDQLNAQDPRTVVVEGTPQPHELAYAKQLTAWVLRLNPQASEALRIAARGQHVCRWTIPREQYPKTREGYLRWRETLKAFHTQKVSELMGEAGYPAEAVERVRTIMSKRQLATEAGTPAGGRGGRAPARSAFRGLPDSGRSRSPEAAGRRATDPDTQTLEDALCLLFLETELADMRRKTPVEALSDVVRKTWRKMSPRARELAGELPLGADDRAFLVRALGAG